MTTTRRSPTGARAWPRSFADRLTCPLPGPRQFVRLLAEGGLRGTGADADRIPVLRNDLPEVTVSDTALTWVGHASYVIRIAGRCVLADPVWSAKLNGVARRMTPPGVAWSALPPVDAVVISHNHYDHLDWPTIRRLPRETPICAPAGLGRWFRRRGFREVIELDWWESTEVAGLDVDFVPAHHWSRRGAFDSCASLWGGWMITAPGGHRVYHAGDSGYGPWFAEIGRRYQGIDVAMLPIGAYDPRWFMSGVHMHPGEAVRAVADLGAPRLAAMHWGTFVLSREPVMEPLLRVRREWAAVGGARDTLWDMAVGETRRVPVGTG